MSPIRFAIVAALLTLPVMARAEDMTMPMPMHQSAAMSPADRANKAAMDTMMKRMMVKPTGNPDKDFALMMLPHHEGAVAMAKVELQYGKDPELLALATAVVAAQEKEIAEMKAWLAKNGS